MIMSARGGGRHREISTEQKIAHLRIVLGARFAYYAAIDFRPDDISYPPVQPV